MGEKSDQIEQHIQEQRSELTEHISELQEKVKGAVDWRVQFNERPMTMIALAFGGGMLLSAILPDGPKHSNGHSYKGSYDAYPDTLTNGDTVYSSAHAVKPPASPSKAWKQATETFETLKGALLGVAASKVGDYLEEVIPGFNDHYKKVQYKSDQYRADPYKSDAV